MPKNQQDRRDRLLIRNKNLVWYKVAVGESHVELCSTEPKDF